MSSYEGKFQFTNPAGGQSAEGSCRLSIGPQNLELVPESGPPLAIDLGDVDEYIPGDYDLALKLYDGSRLLLSLFGKAYQNLAHDLLESYRERTMECLLLEDLEEVLRIEGFVQLISPEREFSGRSELRLYRSNLAVLPEASPAFQWRLADIDDVSFDEAAYALKLRSDAGTLVLGKMGKKTDEFRGALKSAMHGLAEQTAAVIHQLLPFLTPGEFLKTAAVLKEGRTIAMDELQSINPKAAGALLQQTVDENLRPYFELLQNYAGSESIYAGFKLIRTEQEESAVVSDKPEEGAADEQPEAQPMLHWFFFPMRSVQGRSADVVAWEAVSRKGRATYFFRMIPPETTASAIRELNRALVLLNFKREPVYLPQDSLELQPRFRRYAIACRKLPALRRLRSSFLGRAIHTSIDEWDSQVRKILAGAGQ